MCNMVRPSGCRGDADLGPVTDRICRVEGRPVTAKSRGVRGRHSTSDIPVTPTPLAPGFYHGIGEAGSSTQPPAVPFRSRPPLHPHQSHTPVPYESYGSAHPPSHHINTVYDPYLQAPTVVRPRIPYLSTFQEPILYDGSQARQIGDSVCSIHGYSHADYGVSSSDHYVPGPADRVSEGDRAFGLEQERVRTLHIQGESDERGDDDGGDGDGGDREGGDGDGDGGDDDHDDGDDDGDEEQPVYVAPVAPASGSNGCPRHGKGKDLTDSLMSVMSKFAGSRNKRPDVTEAAEGGPVDPELIPSYGGHVAGQIWRGQDRGLLKCRSRYMALTGFNALELHAVATSRQTSQSHQAWIYLYFPMFAPPFRHSPKGCKPYMQMFPQVGHKSERKLLDIRLKLDLMTADECIPAYPIQPREARRLPNNRMYVLRNTFVEALWLEAPSSCTDDYLDWYLPRSHPRIQNPGNIPIGYNVPVAPAMPPQVLLDIIARECHRQDISSKEFHHRV
ncbi:hypothetical protein M9H77_25730 [Catharanthus roseus]|uniref:Uncharacterized protein n=1 Tax=Catharanthus roseus TaxID=4058 RepID=A0ACC0A7P4_CATRO|nr:hypothetical protein M9H77_25730 [Catharanthus roseus]